MTLLQFAILGLGLGGAYALLAIGVVTIYRGTGVPNFAQGALAMMGAYTFYTLRDSAGWGTVSALLAALAVGVLLGVAFHVLVLRQLRDAPVLAKVIATLALLTLLQGLALLWFDVTTTTPVGALPASTMRLLGVSVFSDRVWLAAIAAATATILGALSYTTRTGLAVRAIAENRKGAQLQGYSPDALSMLTWGLGSGLAALAGVLVSPLSGLDANALTLLVVPVFGAAVIARFSSYTLAVLGAFGIGAAQSILQGYSQPGAWWEILWKGAGRAEAFPALLIILVIFVSGRIIPSRGEASLGRMPLSPRPHHVNAFAAVGVGVGGVLISVMSRSWLSSLTATMIAAIVALSLIVITGFAGQISLGQMAFAGASGLAVARLGSDLGVSFVLAVLLGGLVAAVLGVVIGMPSLRVRGPSLAIVTLSAAYVLQRVVFQNSAAIGGGGFARVPAPSLFGLELGHRGFALTVLAVLTALSLAVSNLRRSRTGRRLLSMRENERAAAAAGISVPRLKLQAFALSAFVAGIAGALLSYQGQVFAEQRFTVFESLFAVIAAYIGGIGMVAGAIVAGLATSSGLFAKLLSELGIHEFHRVIAGAGLLLAIQLHPDGLASTAAHLRSRRLLRTGPSRPEVARSTGRPARSDHHQKEAATVPVATSTPREGAEQGVGRDAAISQE